MIWCMIWGIWYIEPNRNQATHHTIGTFRRVSEAKKLLHCHANLVHSWLSYVISNSSMDFSSILQSAWVMVLNSVFWNHNFGIMASPPPNFTKHLWSSVFNGAPTCSNTKQGSRFQILSILRFLLQDCHAKPHQSCSFFTPDALLVAGGIWTFPPGCDELCLLKFPWLRRCCSIGSHLLVAEVPTVEVNGA